VDYQDRDQSAISYIRRGKSGDHPVLVSCNFTPVPRHDYRVGVPRSGRWEEMLNSDAAQYGGSGRGNLGGLDSVPVACHGHDHSLTMTLPPLAVLVFKHFDN
jgi:1,4-alpha-glucan branching enzyme